MLVVLGLWLYPITGVHYCTELLVPIGVVWHNRAASALSRNAIAAFVLAQLVLLNWRDGAYTTGLLLALDCAVLAYAAVRPPARC